MHIFEAISKKLTIVTTSIEQRNFLTAVLDYMQAEPALPFYLDNDFIFKWLQDGTYILKHNKTEIEDGVIWLTDLELTFSIKELSAIWGKHNRTVHQLLKRPENWSSHNIASKNKCGKEVVVTLKFN
jgi:hypothetical protein